MENDYPLEFNDQRHNEFQQLEEEHSEISSILKNLNIFQKIKLRMFGYTFIKKNKLEGWRNFIPFYALYCDKHGLQISYPIGWKNKLVCPKCLQETIKSTKIY